MFPDRSEEWRVWFYETKEERYRQLAGESRGVGTHGLDCARACEQHACEGWLGDMWLKRRGIKKLG